MKAKGKITKAACTQDFERKLLARRILKRSCVHAELEKKLRARRIWEEAACTQSGKRRTWKVIP